MSTAVARPELQTDKLEETCQFIVNISSPAACSGILVASSIGTLTATPSMDNFLRFIFACPPPEWLKSWRLQEICERYADAVENCLSDRPDKPSTGPLYYRYKELKQLSPGEESQTCKTARGS